MTESQSWRQWFQSRSLLKRWVLSLLAVILVPMLFGLLPYSWRAEEGLEPALITHVRNVGLSTIAGVIHRAITYYMIALLVPKPILIGGLVVAIDSLFLLVTGATVILWATTDLTSSFGLSDWMDLAIYSPAGVASIYFFVMLRREAKSREREES